MGNRHFTDGEYDIMVRELTCMNPARFDMLLEIAGKTLSRYIASKCNDSCLRGKGREGEILDDVMFRIRSYVITQFTIHEGSKGADEFNSWMFTIANNAFRDTVSKENNKAAHETDFFSSVPGGDGDDPEEVQIPDTNNNIDERIETEARRDVLRKAVRVVLGSGSEPYITLSWFAWNVFYLNYGLDRTASTHVMEKGFPERTLSEIYDMLISSSKKITWLVIPGEVRRKVEAGLNKKTKDGKTVGETKYKDHFGTQPPAKAISGWLTQMNKLLKREIDNGTSDKREDKSDKRNDPSDRRTDN